MSPGRVLLRCGVLVTDASEEALYDAAVLVEDGRVQSVGRYPALRRSYPLAAEHGGKRLVALPGLVDAHSHGRGVDLCVQGIQDSPLETWLARLTACTPLDPRDDAFVAAADLVTTGVTSAQVFSHSFSRPEDYARELTATAAGLRGAGLRFDLVAGITDQHEFVPPGVTFGTAGTEPPNGAARSLASPVRGTDATAFFELFDLLSGTWDDGPPANALDPSEGDRLVLGPVAPQWCSDAILNGVAERSRRGVRVHTHLLERPGQRPPAFCESPVRRLDDHDLLNDGLSVAHGIWLEPEEVCSLAEKAVAVVHCPGSNTRLGSGTAPMRDLLDAGAPAALGLDSHSIRKPPDVFAEMRRALEMAAGAGAPISAREVFGMATLGGAAALGRRGEIGTLNPGARADLVLLDPHGPPEASGDPVPPIIARASRDSVREVWIGGRAVVREGRPLRAAEVRAARGRLRETLRRDAPRRRGRLRELEALEPWLKETWKSASATR